MGLGMPAALPKAQACQAVPWEVYLATAESPKSLDKFCLHFANDPFYPPIFIKTCHICWCSSNTEKCRNCIGRLGIACRGGSNHHRTFPLRMAGCFPFIENQMLLSSTMHPKTSG